MGTNLKVFGIVIGTLLFYTALANMIPQIESDVPRELSFSAQVTTEELIAAGEQLYAGAGGCTACHGLGTRAPNLLTDQGGTGQIGARCSTRVPGKTCKEYLHESMVNPTAYVVEGYQPIMPDMSRTLSPVQIWAAIAYLESLGGEVTVTPEDLIEAEAASGGAQPVPTTAAGGTPPGAGAAAPADPQALMQNNQCLVCHKLGDQGGPIGPAFDGIGSRLTADQIRRGILEPNADTAQGFAAVAGTMPQTFGQQLTAAQLESLVRYLTGLK